jgi:hypothetical protein
MIRFSAKWFLSNAYHYFVDILKLTQRFAIKDDFSRNCTRTSMQSRVQSTIDHQEISLAEYLKKKIFCSLHRVEKELQNNYVIQQHSLTI